MFGWGGGTAGSASGKTDSVLPGRLSLVLWASPWAPERVVSGRAPPPMQARASLCCLFGHKDQLWCDVGEELYKGSLGPLLEAVHCNDCSVSVDTKNYRI